jgi:hypothetical protein
MKCCAIAQISNKIIHSRYIKNDTKDTVSGDIGEIPIVLLLISPYVATLVALFFLNKPINPAIINKIPGKM